ncbi:hypothetical protein D7322_22310 [Sphingobacterium puteale]|uniref:Uncharacterized protein n=1 Tax=Sphingobacterium puteale TaxID=2420510 RepID=A0A420VSG7_9SPHI|nr:hypothetical protein [Sphingobacterium puteale]RKO69323.1 hypothetical protein D7322_22310 [Sphingobacterium puteale]
MVTSLEATLPPLRSGAKIGRFRADFQDFCFIFFQYPCNSLGTWWILFVKQDPGGSGGRKWTVIRGSPTGSMAERGTGETESWAGIRTAAGQSAEPIEK